MNRSAGPLTRYFARPSPAARPAGIAAMPIARDYAALVARITAAIHPPLSWHVYGQQATADGAERYDLLLVRIPAVGRDPAGAAGPAAGDRRVRHVLLNGGTHGEEPAGAEALVRFLEQRRYLRWPAVAFTLTPCANPWGYVHHRREGPGGHDLNRAFRRAGRATPEVARLKRALGRRAWDLLVDCHEDEDAPGLYAFAAPLLGRAVVAAAGALGPVHPGPQVDDVLPLAGGVVGIDSARTLERRRTWPLPFYVAQLYQRASDASGGRHRGRRRAEPAWAVVETPVHLPLDQRVAMHLAAIDAVLAA
jgi:hypothetical protein